jgi:hypothetical protein
VVFLIGRFKLQGIWTPLIIILFLCFQPLYANISYGQGYIFIFCLLVLAWFAYRSDSEKWLGFIIGLIFILKTTSFVLWILLPVQKKWKSLAWAFVTVVFFLLVTLPWVGLDSWYMYGNKLASYASHPSASVTAYQTVHSFFHHLTVYDQQWNPEPVFHLPFFGKLLSIIFSFFIIATTSYYAFKFKEPDLSFGAFIIAGIVISPASLDYHYVIALIPILIFVN